ncbi:hypothetical protein KR093_000499, partial [Drosophila rubida]
RLENNLLSSAITVQNGSLSHVQLLDTLPNEKSKLDSDIALKMLKASLYIYNSRCDPAAISGDQCRTYLETKPLPEGTLKSECQRLLQTQRDGHHAFRRLLPQDYKDGFHELYNEHEQPNAWDISMALYDRENEASEKTRSGSRSEDSRNLNLVLVQFAQFVEHDLSKTVSQSMSSGSPIECCNREQHNLQPRFHHPFCAPITSQDKYGFHNCLNYVRSALAVGENCNFGGAEQLNQATGVLDLSQLYGFTDAAQRKMRTLSKGTLKSTSNGNLLPRTSDSDEHTFCAWGDNANATNCFVAGDSRVNSNPLSILVYTIFMRNHNRIASELSVRNKNWSDEQLFQAAKTINVDIYRRVIMNEWLPEVLGANSAAQVLNTPAATTGQQLPEVSNEFGVAAIRFYFSMLPNVLHNVANANDIPSNNNILPLTNLVELKNEIYTPQIQYTPQKLNEILQSLLHERAMKMDASYVGAVSSKGLHLTCHIHLNGISFFPRQIVWHERTKPTHADVLAFDIQRGRDHGLQPYYKYLEACSNTKKVTGWADFEPYIPGEVLDKLKNLYRDCKDVDLIIGGISERIVNGTVGPTFSCILSEQFSKIHQRHQLRQSSSHNSILDDYQAMNGSKLLCLNSNVHAVPENIFRLQSNR